MVQTLSPLMTQERIERIERVRKQLAELEERCGRRPLLPRAC